MKIIRLIYERPVIKKILVHLKLRLGAGIKTCTTGGRGRISEKIYWKFGLCVV